MVITALILSIVSIIIGCITFILLTMVVNHLMSNSNLAKDEQLETIQNSKHIPDGMNDTFQDGYDAANDHFWYILQLSIFDMYRNMDILDFDSLIGSIKSKMDNIITDADLRSELIDELQNYFKGENN